MPQKQPDHTQGQFHITYILLTQSSATNQTHVELTSGVGAVAAVAALAATLLRPQINIHNLLKLL